MNRGDSLGYKILNQVVGGWNIAGVSTWNPKGTPLLVPDVPGGVTAPGATLRYSLAPGVKIKQSSNYSAALANPYKGEFISSTPTPVLNSSAFVVTQPFTLSNAPFVFPSIRNPGSFYTDATLLKKFPFSAEGSRYFELRMEAQNIFNHANFNNIDNNPTDATFGAVMGKSGQRIMQIGARFFF
jgi:hypothetical protein